MSVNRARRLRRDQTSAESELWTHLRNRAMAGFKFRRQVPLGPYVVDFVCFDERLIVEVDGGQHNLEPNRDQDCKRTAWLESQGYRVIRFWNIDILDSTEGVLGVIRSALARE